MTLVCFRRAVLSALLLTAFLLPASAADQPSVQFKSAKGADACRQTEEELARPSGGALDTGPVLRVFLKSPRIKNFGQVNDHLFRGAEPSPQGLQDLADMHIVLDVDLREAGESTEAERNLAGKLGMKYINVPLNGFAAPKPDEIKRVLSLISADDTGNMFVHCRRGKDRTGTVIACYRIEHDGWENEKAAAEANRYGMSRLEPRMRAFVMNFKPIDLAPPLQAEK